MTGPRADLLVQRDFLTVALEVAAAGIRAIRSLYRVALQDFAS